MKIFMKNMHLDVALWNEKEKGWGSVGGCV